MGHCRAVWWSVQLLLMDELWHLVQLRVHSGNGWYSCGVRACNVWYSWQVSVVNLWYSWGVRAVSAAKCLNVADAAGTWRRNDHQFLQTSTFSVSCWNTNISCVAVIRTQSRCRMLIRWRIMANELVQSTCLVRRRPRYIDSVRRTRRREFCPFTRRRLLSRSWTLRSRVPSRKKRHWQVRRRRSPVTPVWVTGNPACFPSCQWPPSTSCVLRHASRALIRRWWSSGTAYVLNDCSMKTVGQLCRLAQTCHKLR